MVPKCPLFGGSTVSAMHLFLLQQNTGVYISFVFVFLRQTSGVPWQGPVWESESWCVEPLSLQQQPWGGGSREVSGGRVNRGGKSEVPAGGRHHGTVQTSQHHQDSRGRHHLRPCEI